ncbi:unnamed protein product [Clonostachys rhizophaga]|uniref:Uncharacterized protein n=1 Tax=Clonostachys rhizophaga TaxID=160324 RepID=A0A9N9VNI1_9HYPO|nr:unnamed protein product [Clonostachys rhizophaga]
MYHTTSKDMALRQDDVRPALGPDSPKPIPPVPDPSPPDPDPSPPRPQPDCRSDTCYIGLGNIKSEFPSLTVLPRPEPSQDSAAEHALWEAEFEQWGGLQCGCGNGYFCREHGDWISGGEVLHGHALPRGDQKNGCCPTHHYQGPGDRDSYVGQRDGAHPCDAVDEQCCAGCLED